MATASFEITIEGEIHPDFAPMFEPATVTCRAGRTTVRADTIDQATLHGLLDRIASQRLSLISVVRIGDDGASQVPLITSAGTTADGRRSAGRPPGRRTGDAAPPDR